MNLKMINELAVNYTDSQLRALVEEYIMQQKSTLSIKGACDYVLFWAIEEDRRSDTGLFEGTALQPNDQERVKRTLEAIAKDGRIAPSSSEGIYDRVKN
jgi:hypothetical protein